MTHPPLISVAITPKTKADQEKLGVGLQKLIAEDQALHVNTEQQPGQTVKSGISQLHREIIVD